MKLICNKDIQIGIFPLLSLHKGTGVDRGIDYMRRLWDLHFWSSKKTGQASFCQECFGYGYFQKQFGEQTRLPLMVSPSFTFYEVCLQVT